MTGLWSWALTTYAQPGVAEACLTLQDAHGQNIPFLLWAAWAAGEGRVLTPALLVEAAELAARWDAAAVGPLRAVRRATKPSQAGIDDEVREALRAEVKALELKAERALMASLEALAPPPSAQPLALTGALAAASAAWRKPAPEDALFRLAHTLS